MGDDFLVQKLPSCLFYVSNHNLCFAQVFNYYFFRYAFPLNSDDFSVKAFFLQLHFVLIFSAVLRLILSFNCPWYFPEKSGIIYLFFRHVSVDIQWILSCFNLFSWAILFIHWLFIYLFVINSLFRYFLILSFQAV